MTPNKLSSRNWEERLKELANKYHVGDMLDKPFYMKMCTTWLLCKEKTGRDPHEWLKHFDTHTYKEGAIGWIDALNAIEAVFNKLNKSEKQTSFSEGQRELRGKIEGMKHKKDRLGRYVDGLGRPLGGISQVAKCRNYNEALENVLKELV